jgi:hypothetical protein
MSELKDRLLKQLETDYLENAKDCLKIYEALEKLNRGSVPGDQWMSLVNVQHLEAYPNYIRVYSPSDIGYIFLKGLKGEIKTFTLTLAKAREVYPKVSKEFKRELEDTFGIENLVLSFRELIKTYEDTCEIIGVMPEIDCDSKSELARLKLIRIYEASNVLNHWKFAPLKAQLGFYPSFILEKGKIVFHEMCSNMISFSSDPKLCCGLKEDAYYIGTHFIDLYRDYLLPEF